MKELQEIDLLIFNMKQKTAENTNTAVVIFNSVIGAHTACQTAISRDPYLLDDKSLNLDPNDIIWENINLSTKSLLIRKKIFNILNISVILLFAVPITTFTQISNIGDNKNEISENSTAFQLFLNSILPNILVSILTSVSPVVFKLMSTVQGQHRKSKVRISVMRKYFAFLIIATFLSVTITKNLDEAKNFLRKASQNPLKIFEYFGNLLPAASRFFINTLLLKALIGSQQTLLQPSNYLQRRIFPLLFTYSPRAKLDFVQTQKMEYEIVWSDHIFAFVLGIVYFIVAPTITFFLSIYFILYYWVYKYQVIYVYKTDGYFSDSFYIKAVDLMFIGIYIFQILLCGIMLDLGFEFALLSFILLCVTAMYHKRIHKKYNKLMKYIPFNFNNQSQNFIENKKEKNFYQPEKSFQYLESKLKEYSHEKEKEFCIWIPKDSKGFYEYFSQYIRKFTYELGYNNKRYWVCHHGAYIEDGIVELKNYSYPEDVEHK